MLGEYCALQLVLYRTEVRMHSADCSLVHDPAMLFSLPVKRRVWYS